MSRIAATTVAKEGVGPRVYTAPLMPLGPRLRRGLAVGAAALALAPASALAQGAGDDQYSDPFGSDEQAATPTPAPRAPAATATPAPVQPAATAAPGQPPPAAPPPPPRARRAPGAPRARPPPAAPPAPPGPSLPYTGFEAWLPAAGGALLLGAGLTLRARSRADERS